MATHCSQITSRSNIKTLIESISVNELTLNHQAVVRNEFTDVSMAAESLN